MQSATVSDQVLMALAGIAYAAPADIPQIIASYALTKYWKTTWIADAQDVPVNFAFVATSPTGDVVVAIRGTYPVPWNAAYWDDATQESPMSPFLPWPHANNGANVTQGLLDGFNNVLALVGNGVSFVQVIDAIPPTTNVTVVGHSLGGSLAPLVAHWLSLRRKSVTVSTFAGMTPGDAAFADLFGPSGVPVERWWNTLDTVPYGWDRVADTEDFYQPAPQGGVIVRAAIAYLAEELSDKGFAPVGVSRALVGTTANPEYGYLYQNLHQHLPNTYLAMMGAPPLPFTLAMDGAMRVLPYAAVTSIT